MLLVIKLLHFVKGRLDPHQQPFPSPNAHEIVPPATTGRRFDGEIHTRSLPTRSDKTTEENIRKAHKILVLYDSN
jgi:hypothetical protein